ncbi:MAG: pilus assembly protein [Silicimonas sp.]|nr:pilus assembly protein [Silicimonas sp.]
MRVPSIKSAFARFRRQEDGVALVEFAIFLPLFVFSFFVIVEFSRTFFSYQGAVVGVRDAARYAARTFDPGLCIGEANGGGGTATIGTAALPDTTYNIIERNMVNEIAALPENIRIVSVSTNYRCVVPGVAGTYRQAEVPIAMVFATIEITLPMARILELNGRPIIPSITTVIGDESRVFGV